MITPPKTAKPPKIKDISIRDWQKGTVTAFDDGRTPITGLRASGNIMLDQDGTLRPRPSLMPYGPEFLGTCLGIDEFVRLESGETVNYLITLQNVSGTTSVYTWKSGDANWTIRSGKTYDGSATCHFLQADDKVLVMNGTDNLSYLDLDSFAVVPFTALTTPSAPTLAQTGMAGTTYTHYYKITANSTVGETAASGVTSVQTNKLRDAWVSGSIYVTVSWSAVDSARSYNVYYGDVNGEETLIAAGINGTSFIDDGVNARDITRPAPLGDTTAGPKVTRGAYINGVIFLVGDADNPRYVRYGGTGQNVLDFSPYNGGGWTEVGRGGKELPVVVTPPPAGAERAHAMVLCRSTNGKGKRYTMNPQTITEGETIIAYYEVKEDNGQDGTDSPDGVVLYDDNLWFPSRDGFKTTGTKPQLQTFYKTDTISETITDRVQSLSSTSMDKCIGLAYQRRLYWALPVGSSDNNEIWVLDLNQKGAWMTPWNIAATFMKLYNDNDGRTHFLVVSGNVLYELTDSQATMDDTVAFRTNATSGFIKFSENGLEWAKIIDVTFVVLRPQGQISFTVSGKTEDGQLEGLGQETFTSTSTVAGWGEAGFNTSGDGAAEPTIYGWSNFSVVPVRYGDAARYIVVEPEDEDECQWLTWELNTSSAGVNYQLADVIIRYVNIGVKDLT